jgi:hypothetical protein
LIHLAIGAACTGCSGVALAVALRDSSISVSATVAASG